MPMDGVHQLHVDPRCLVGFLSKAAGGEKDGLTRKMEAALDPDNTTQVFSPYTEGITQLAGATVFEFQEVHLYDVDKRTLWVKPRAAIGRRVVVVRLPGDTLVMSSALAAGGCELHAGTRGPCIRLASAMDGYRLAHTASPMAKAASLPAGVADAVLSALPELDCDSIIALTRFDGTVQATACAVTGALTSWANGMEPGVGPPPVPFRRYTDSEGMLSPHARAVDDIWRGRMGGGVLNVLKGMKHGAMGGTSTVDQQEARAAAMRTDPRHAANSVAGSEATAKAKPAVVALREERPDYSWHGANTVAGREATAKADPAVVALREERPNLSWLAAQKRLTKCVSPEDQQRVRDLRADGREEAAKTLLAKRIEEAEVAKKVMETSRKRKNHQMEVSNAEEAAKHFVAALNGDNGREVQRGAFDELDRQIAAGGKGSMTTQRVMSRMFATQRSLHPGSDDVRTISPGVKNRRVTIMIQGLLQEWAPARAALEAAERA